LTKAGGEGIRSEITLSSKLIPGVLIQGDLKGEVRRGVRKDLGREKSDRLGREKLK